MRNIHVVTLGPGAPSLLTLGAADKLKKAKHLILRTSRHGVCAWLNEHGIAFESLDALYDRFDDFDELNEALAKAVLSAAEAGTVCYAVADASTDASVGRLLPLLSAEDKCTVEAGVSPAQECLSVLPAELRDAEGRLRVVPALAVNKAAFDPSSPLLVTEIDNAALAGDVKIRLSSLYGDEQRIVFFPPSETQPRKLKELPLYELDRQKRFDHTCCVYVPVSPLRGRERFGVGDLEEVMRILRGEGGCPWDLQQTHASLRPYLIEEAYEAAGAIDSGDPMRLADELGDVLLQVVFHAQVGAEHGEFDMTDVATAICRKMMYRHAHIFGDAKCATAAEVSANWEQLKKKEKGLDSAASVMEDVAASLPALLRASKVQSKAHNVGFDWDDAKSALDKVYEEADEVKAELENGSKLGEELGDLLFSCVNVARLSGLQSEKLLEDATNKFISRFKIMENLINADGKSLKGLTLSEMDVYWNKVKTLRKARD